MGYCAISDLTSYGLPSTAFGSITGAQQQSAIDSTAKYMDSFFRARYALPFTAWGLEVTRCNAILAVEEILTIRGWDPSNAGDAAIVTRAQTMRDWLAQVQRGAAHPDVTPTSVNAPNYASPKIFSTSTVSPQAPDTGPNRGW